MTILVNSGTTLPIPPDVTLTADSTIEAGGILTGGGSITGAFDLLNDGLLDAFTGPVTVATGSFNNQGTVEASSFDVTVAASLDTANFSNGTLTGGAWWAVWATIALPVGPITTDDADIEIIGGGPTLPAAILEQDPDTSGTQSILNTVTDVGVGGVLDITQLSAWSVAGSFVADGTVFFDVPDGGISGGGPSGSGTLSAADGITVSSTGTLDVQGTIASPLIIDGTLDVVSTLALEDAVSGTGTIEIQPGGLLNRDGIVISPDVSIIQGSGLSGTVVSGGSLGFLSIQDSSSLAASSVVEVTGALSTDVGFVGYNPNNFPEKDLTGVQFGELILDSPLSFSGTIQQFNNDSTIVLENIIGESVTFNGTVLSILNAGETVDALTFIPETSIEQGAQHFIDISQDYSNISFVATPDSINNNTTITASGIVDTYIDNCFLAGTDIATPSGSAPIEQLAVGDRVIAHFGGEQRVIWTGSRTIDCRRRPHPSQAWPVRISPHAFGPEQPRTALFLSLDHAVFVDDVLIPIRYLVNGTTIRQIAMDRVTYHHIELEEHDVVIANGLAAESYLDQNNHGFFTNAAAPIPLFPNFGVQRWETAGCAPLVVTGPRLAQVRRRVEKQAAGLLATAASEAATASAA
jgi:Hint domain